MIPTSHTAAIDRVCLEGFGQCFEVGKPPNCVGNGLVFEVKSCTRMEN